MAISSKLPRVGLVGYGYWGPNLLRNLFSHGGFDVAGVVEPSPSQRERCARTHPHLPLFTSLDEFLEKGRLEAVLIATPPSTHFQLAMKCLERGLHILVEKPMAQSVSECDQILSLARKNGCKVMVDHTFAFNPAVQYLAREAHSGSLGKLLYYDSVRINLGGYQRSTNVLWDLAPHDLSILDLVLKGKLPESISTMAASHFDDKNANLCYCHLKYDGGFVAHLHLNWVAPTKVRTVLLGGTQKMCVYDENLPAEKVKVFNKGLVVDTEENRSDPRISYREGEVLIPAVSCQESLSIMLDSFHRYLVKGEVPISDGESGRRIVSLLEAASLSLAQGGSPISFDGASPLRLVA